MIDYENKIKKLFENDPYNLLDVKISINPTEGDKRLTDSFFEIKKFYKKNRREPKLSNDISERRLAVRLEEIKKDLEKKKLLKKYDEFNLLGDVKEIKNIQDILENDFLGILDIKEEEELFDIKHFQPDRERADFVARRKPCKDFHKYEPLFKKIHKDLKDGKRKILTFKEQDLKEGSFFILSGIIVYLESVDLKSRTFKDKSQGERKRQDNRIRCIFENERESNMYFRSLQKLLYNDGKYISESNDEALEMFDKNLASVTKDDKLTGHIYVLKSLSENPKIKNIPNLYKIGFCTTDVKERIKNAKNDPTFLNNEVQIILDTEIYNYPPNKIEEIVQNFFSSRKLDIDIADKKGFLVKPKEWFIVPINIISKAVDLLSRGELSNYQFEDKSNSIKQKIDHLIYPKTI